MLKSWSLRGKNELSKGLAFLFNTILSKRSSMAGEAVPETELTSPVADPANMTSLELSMSYNDRAAVSISGTAGTSGQHPEPSTRPVVVGRLNQFQFGGIRDGRHYLPNPTMSGQLRIDMADAGLDYELRLSNRPSGATQSSVGIVEQDEESVTDLESQLGGSENSDTPVSGVQANVDVRARLQVPYILFGLGTNITLSLVNIKLIHELKLPASTPTLPEGVLAAAAGIGLFASAPAIYLQVKNPRSVLAKVLSQISVISLGCSVLVKLSTRFLFEQYELVNIVATALLFLFIVGVVIQLGRSTAS